MDEAVIKRILPHSQEAEQAVIGAMLMNKDAITTASEIISGEDFYQNAYGILFDAMVELFQMGHPVDLITLQEHLKGKKCPAGSQQSGVCPGSDRGSADFGEREVLCADRK